MKKTFVSSLNFLFIFMMVSTIFLVVNANGDSSFSTTTEEFQTLKVEQTNITELNFFDVTDFTNTSHVINVSRTINANEYGYTTSLTQISLLNNGTKSINAFNLTIPKHEYLETKYLNIYSENDTEEEGFTEWKLIEENNETVVFVVIFPSVGVKESIKVNIQMDHPSAISFYEDGKLEADDFPYHFNLSFIPLISLPMTSYNLTWGIGEGAEFSLNNDTLKPQKENYTGNYKLNEALFKITFSNITELTSINRDSLNSTDYLNYNLSKLGNRRFIPAYTPNLKENMSLYLSLDYYQFSYTIIEFKSLKTSVTVSEWGIVTTSHEMIVHNRGLKSGNTLSTDLGGPTFPAISFHIPETAGKIGMNDHYGNITPSIFPGSQPNSKMVQVTPRIRIAWDQEYYLYLSYRQQISDIAKDLGGGKIQLNLPLTFSFNWTVSEFNFNLYLPSGSNFKLSNIDEIITNSTLRELNSSSTTTKKELLGIFNKPGAKILLNNFTPLSNRIVKITFGLDPFHLIYTPASIIVFFLIIGIIYTIIRNVSFGLKPKRIALEEIPIDQIRDFVKTYEEKTAIREQILRLDRKRRSKNISAREYEQTRTILMNRQQRADRSIVNVSRKLAEEGQRYRKAMRTIEVAEANREDILLNLESLERKKAQGRIGKDAYAKLKLNYDKQLRSANNEIDKVLIELRSLLTK